MMFHPSILYLLQEYEQCNSIQAERLLEDIEVHFDTIIVHLYKHAKC